MKQKFIVGALAAILGMFIAVMVVNSMKDESGDFTKIDSTVEEVMITLFKSPPAVTDHGWNVDRMIVYVEDNMRRKLSDLAGWIYNIIPADISPEKLKEMAENLNRELNELGQNKRQATVDKYKSFNKSGKSADGDRKYHFGRGNKPIKFTPGIGEQSEFSRS